jgi:hypothetical protein
MSRSERQQPHEQIGDSPGKFENSEPPDTRDENVYEGIREPDNPVGEETTVTVNGEELSYRYDLLSASPSGFEWGYRGSGPAQLAISMLAFECGDEIAGNWYQVFKEDIVAELPAGGWTLQGSEIREYLETECGVEIDV